MSALESDTLREVTPELDYDGQFRILSVIKEGRLFLAAKAGKRVILKTSDGSAKGIEKLKREYELSIGLSHPGLAYVFTYEEQCPVGPCIVQEYVDGETLSDWLSHHPSQKERSRICSELLSVMEYLHRKGVVHNDLKPDNILIGRSGGSLKLIDFGFADDDTHEGKAMGGTRAYASPELLTGGKVDARSDVYSLGLLIRDMGPRWTGRIVRRCLRKDPADRFASAGEVARSFRRRRLPIWITVAIFIAMALGALTLEYAGARRELAALKNAEDARTEALAAAKAEVDQWYAVEIPKYREAIAKAASPGEVVAAWTELANRTAVINEDLPSRTPEAVRPALRDYLLQRHNEVFPGLLQEMIARQRELTH